MSAPWTDLERRYSEIRDLEHGLAILGWDQEVMMPAGGAEGRAHALAALSTVLHQRRSDPALVRLVERLHRRRAGLRPQQRRALELVRHEVRKATLIPADLARDLALAESRGLETWRRAREQSDFSRFAPALAHMLDLKRRQATLTASGGRLYDALLDDFEPGATIAQIQPLLDALKELTVPLVRRVRDSGVKPDISALVGSFGVDAQRAFAREVVEAMGIDPQRSRLDLSTHPFCGGVAPGDVRMTSRYHPRDTRGGLFSAIHEAGHGLYEQGLSERRARHPLGGAVSMALHESQSRLWENNVARGRPFWTCWLPRLKRHHKGLKGVRVDDVWRAANEIRPSLIRTEADELTYNLHIVLRYEIERDLIEGRLEVRDLPGRWNQGMTELLGITPRRDSEGVLQDIHWAMGLFGYFPTYSLGNLYAAQIMEAARKDLRGLDGRIARGDLKTLRGWLGEKIHSHDRRYSAPQVLRRVTGRPPGTEAFRRYITGKVKALYG